MLLLLITVTNDWNASSTLMSSPAYFSMLALSLHVTGQVGHVTYHTVIALKIIAFAIKFFPINVLCCIAGITASKYDHTNY